MTRTPSPRPSSVRGSIDLGRIVMVPAFGFLAAVSGAALGTEVARTTISAGELVQGLLLAAFYLLLAAVYLLRRAPRRTSSSWRARLVAVAVTWLPVSFALVTGHPRGSVALAAGSLLTVTGLAWSVWSLVTLGRSFSIVPQARELVQHGPYRLVRHPLYLGELVATLGFVVQGMQPVALAIWLLAVAGQLYRADQEEQVLADSFPGYEAYRQRTARLVPGIY